METLYSDLEMTVGKLTVCINTTEKNLIKLLNDSVNLAFRMIDNYVKGREYNHRFVKGTESYKVTQKL